MKMFRWSGFISFIVFTAVLTVIGFFFIDNWTRKAVEAAGFQLNGAEVNVGNADLTLSPLGFKFTDVEIADAEKPTHNVLVLGEVNLDINFPQLFLGNVRMQDVTVADVQTNTLRQRQAKVAEESVAEKEEATDPKADGESATSQLAKQFPEPSDIIEEQTSNTRTAVNNADKIISESKTKVADSVSNLPGDDDLAAYKKRIADIKAIELDSLDNIQKTQKLVEGVTTDLAKDKLSIEKVKLNINSAVKDSRTAVDNILDAPGEDWDQLKADYPLNKDSALKVAQMLLGESFFERIDQAKYWYGKAKPWLARLKSEEEEAKPERLRGEFVRFQHPDPTASFQLDQGVVSFISDNWPWTMTVSDLTTHVGSQYKPTQLLLRRGDEGKEALLINGVLDVVEGQSVDTFTLSGNGIAFGAQKIELAGTDLNWVPEKANVAGQIVSTGGDLKGKVALVFPSNQFSAQGSGQSTKFISTALKTIDQFQVNVLVSGTVKKPKFSIQSDLDNKLSNALGDVASAEYQAWLAGVKSELDKEVAKLRAPIDKAQAELESTRKKAEDKIQQFEDEVEAEVRSLESKVVAERKRLEDKAKADVEAAKQKAQAELDAAKKKAEAEAEAARKKAEAEKKAAEEAAKKAAEEKLKEEADKLKGKIKF